MWQMILLVAAVVLLFVLVVRRKWREAAGLDAPSEPLLPLNLPPRESRPRQQTVYVPKKLKIMEPRADDEPDDEDDVPLAGINHINMAGTHRQSVIARCAVGEEIVLARDPENPYDENAIRCLRRNGEDIGFLPAWYAEDLAPHMDDGHPCSAKISSIEPFVSGAGNKLLGVSVAIIKYKRLKSRRSKRAAS